MTTLKWDGSYLGDYPRSCLRRKFTMKNGLTITIIKTKDFMVKCLLRALRNVVVPCILDQLKECFGLRKIGTHRLKIGGKKYVMYKCKLTDTILTKVCRDETVVRDVKVNMQSLIGFRCLMSIPHTQNSSFIVRKEGDVLVPYSLYEPNTFISERSVNPSETFLELWCDKEDISDVIMKKLVKSSESDLTSFLLKLKDEVEKIVSSIDPSYIWIGGYITEKIVKNFAYVDH